jgi:phosphoribosylaminoimidazolecarboxamide formyltransferase/IMP cyclohydrolase
MDDHFPPQMEISFIDQDQRQTLFYEKVVWVVDEVQKGLRYGENPGQEAALYKLVNGNLVLGETETIQSGQFLASDIELLQSGKHPGKTNDTLVEAYTKANMADRVAAFGGCIAVNQPVDRVTAEAVIQQYAEVVVAPDFEEGVMGVFSQKPNLRVVKIGNIERLQTFVGQRCVGIIAQWSFVPTTRSREDLRLAECEYRGKPYKINRRPTEKEYDDLIFGWLLQNQSPTYRKRI